MKAACDIRKTWTKSLSNECGSCKGLAVTPFCSCFDNPESASCESQQNALKADTTCDAVTKCVNDCHDDCACLEACYVGHDNCRTLGSAVDGCVTQLCDKDCR